MTIAVIINIITLSLSLCQSACLLIPLSFLSLESKSQANNRREQRSESSYALLYAPGPAPRPS